MPQLNVPDLVGQDRRKGVLIPAAAQQTPRHEDEAARRGKGVDVVGIEDKEVIAPENDRQIRSLGEDLADDVHILVGHTLIVCRIFPKDDRPDGPSDIVFLFRCEFLGAP